MYVDKIRRIAEGVLLKQTDPEVLNTITKYAEKGWVGILIYRKDHKDLFDLFEKNANNLEGLGFCIDINKDVYDKTYIKVRWIFDKK
jgi:hypothetical protein